jgi:hypothetical protein
MELESPTAKLHWHIVCVEKNKRVQPSHRIETSPTLIIDVWTMCDFYCIKYAGDNTHDTPEYYIA